MATSFADNVYTGPTKNEIVSNFRRFATIPHLLLVEDSPTQALHFKLHFEKLGYKVTTVTDGEQAFNLLQSLETDGRSKLPNLIVLDLMLPAQNGIVVCRQLKSQPDFCRIPTLVFSAINSLEQTIQAYQAGADYYVVKGPDSMSKLELLIKTLTTKTLRRPSLAV